MLRLRGGPNKHGDEPTPIPQGANATGGRNSAERPNEMGIAPLGAAHGWIPRGKRVHTRGEMIGDVYERVKSPGDGGWELA